MTSVNTSKESDDCLEEYLLAVAKEDASAFEALYMQTKTAVYAFALSVLKNTHDAEDVLQECFVRVHHSAGQYTPCGKPMAWIMTIAKNLCYKRFNERKQSPLFSEEDWESYLQANESLLPEDRVIIKEMMNSLSDEERQIVVLHAISGFKHREIARILDLPLSTVLSKYHRAIKKLKQLL